MFVYQGKNYDFPIKSRKSCSINELKDVKVATEITPFTGVFGGFVEVLKGKIFYTLVKARKPQEGNPVIVYMLGGPGAPSSPFLACGLGPFQVALSGKNFVLTDNPNTWAENAHLILIDNPRGCGYSQVEGTEYVTTAEEAAADLKITIPMILKKYQLEKNPLYIGGISYGGTYVPHTANALIESGQAVEGLIMASGYTDPLLVLNSYVTSYIQRGFLFPNEQEKIKGYVSEFAELVKNGNYKEASNYVDDTGLILTYIQKVTGIQNWLDLSNPFGSDVNFIQIMNAVQFVTEGRNLFPIGDNKFNADPNSGLNWDVYNNLKTAMAKSALPQLRALMDKKISMLFMGGQYDGMVPFDATDKMLELLKENKATKELLEAPCTSKQLANSKGNILGYYRSSQMGSQKIYQGIIQNSGHMLDIDQPAATKALVELFLQ